jgi:hypothetical protein
LNSREWTKEKLMTFFSKIFKPNVEALVKRGNAIGLLNALKFKNINYEEVNSALEAFSRIKHPKAILALREIAMIKTRPPVIDGAILEGVVKWRMYSADALSSKAIQILGQIGGEEAGKALIDILNEQQIQGGFVITNIINEVLSAIKESQSTFAIDYAIDYLIKTLDIKYSYTTSIIEWLEYLGWKPRNSKEIAHFIFAKYPIGYFPTAVESENFEVRESLVALIASDSFNPKYVQTLEALGTHSAVDTLKKYLERPEIESSCKWEIAHALYKISEPDSFAPLLHYFENDFYHIEKDLKKELPDILIKIFELGGNNVIVTAVNLYIKIRSSFGLDKQFLDDVKTVFINNKNRIFPFFTNVKNWNGDIMKIHEYAECVNEFDWISELSSEILKIIAIQAGEKIGTFAVEAVGDQLALVDIAKAAKTSVIRQVAVKKLTDQKLLLELATGNDKEVSVVAIDQLSDQVALLDLATNGNSLEIREAARNKITDSRSLLKASLHNIEDLGCFHVVCKEIQRLRVESDIEPNKTVSMQQAQNAINILEENINEIIATLKSKESHNRLYTTHSPAGYGGNVDCDSWREKGYDLIDDLRDRVKDCVSFISDGLLLNLSELDFKFKKGVDTTDKYWTVETIESETINCEEINLNCEEELRRRNRGSIRD